jgi:hypothetical protein
MTTLSAPEILRKHNLAYIATMKGKYTTKCPNCGEGYCDVKIDREGVQWYCHHCEKGDGEFFEQRDENKKNGLGPLKACWDYSDENRKRLFQVLRFEPPGQLKKFIQRRAPEQEKWLTTLPGGPCVLALCHPIKHVIDPNQLLPRGGGAFLNEVDGNLSAWKRDEDIVELHHTGKLRGPGFEPISFGAHHNAEIDR